MSDAIARSSAVGPTRLRDWPRWLSAGVAVLLLLAAGLKAHQLATQPLPPGGWLEQRWVLLVGVEWELLLAAWLLSRFVPRWVWAAATVTFAGLTGLTLLKVIRGERSCGCFGVIEVNPWVTLALDVAVLCLLAIGRPRRKVTGGGIPWLRLTVAGAGVILAGTAAAVGALRYQPSQLLAGGQIAGTDRFVVLEPGRWVGQSFPLAPHVQLSQPFMGQTWVLIFHRRDCPHCQAMLPKLEELLKQRAAQGATPRVATIEMAPYAAQGQAPAAGVIQGRLSDTRDWFVATPLVVVLEAGRVVFAEDQASRRSIEDALFVATMGRPPPVPDPLEDDEPPPCCRGDEDGDTTWFWNLEPKEGTPVVRVGGRQVRHDFGAVLVESVHTALLEINNTGAAPLRLTEVRSECTCLLAQPERLTIPPGGKEQLLLGFKAPKIPVGYRRRLLLKIEGAEPIVVTIEANVTARPASRR